MNSLNAENILKHELIGLDVSVINFHNPSENDVFGKVIDETLNTLVLSKEGKPIRIMKKNAVFTFNLPEGGVEVNGITLVGRPEDRIKRRLKRRW
jgi:ribonuclease P protein subunit POP4